MDKTFKRDFLALFSGTTLAQAIPFLLAPVISRIFTAEDIAVYGLYVAILEVLAIVVSGRYELTIVMPKLNSDANQLVFGSLLISFLFSVMIFISVLFGANELGELFKNPNLSFFLYFLPLSLLFYAVTKVLNNFLIRNKKYIAIATYKLSHKTGETLTALVLGKLHLINGLVMGDLFGRFLLAVLTIRSSFKADLAKIKPNWQRIVQLLKEYRDFPLFNSVPAVLNSLATQLPVFMISAYYSAHATGNFNFARMILVAPLALISTTVSQILSQKIAQLYNEKKSITAFLKPVILILSTLAILMVLILFPFSGPLFSFIFGEQWILAGEMTSILVFAFALQFVLTALYPIFYILKFIKMSSIWQVFYFVIISLLYFARGESLNDFLRIFVYLNTFSFAIYGILIYFALKKYESSLKYGIPKTDV